MIEFDYNGRNREALNAKLDALDCSATIWHVTIRPKKSKRSSLQNELSHGWYGEIAKALDSDTADGWKCYCKLHHGVGIMRRDNPEFKQVYDEAIKGLSYEKKLQIMKILPVTSLMNTAQLNEYLESVQADFMTKNVILTFPNEVIYEQNHS